MPGRFPFALLVALLAYGVTDRLVWSYSPWLRLCARYAPLYSAHDYPMRTSVRIRLLPSDESQAPILLLGSSQVYEGLDCAPIERRFPGRTCVNLGTAGGSPLDVLYLLDLVEPRVKKHVVVVAFFPNTLHEIPKSAFTDVRTLGLLVRSRALLHMEPHEWMGVVDGELQNLSETLRMSASLQAAWTLVSRDPRAALRLELPPPEPRKFLPRPLKELQEQTGKILDDEATPGRFTRANELAIEEIISRETRLGNRVIVVDCPTRSGYETLLLPERIRHYQRLLADLALRPEVTVVRRTDMPPVQDEDFRDFVHLMPAARDKTSAGLAEILARVGA